MTGPSSPAEPAAPVAPVDDEAARRQETAFDDAPIHRTLGLVLRIPEPGLAEVTFRPNHAVLNRHGVIGGAVTAAMVDSACVQAVRTLLPPGTRPSTADLSATYLRPIGPDLTITAHGRAEFVGGRLAVGTCALQDEQGTTYAIGKVVVALRRPAATGGDGPS